MNRRTLLSTNAAAASTLLGGCFDRGSTDGTTPTEGTDDRPASTPTGDPDGGTPTGDSDDGAGTEDPGTPTGTDEGTPGEPRLVEKDMEIKSVDCGSGEDHWEVDVTDGVVTVDGAIGGNDGCYSARIDTAEYDGDEDVLRTVIESYDDSRDGETGCMECIVDIYYQATFTFEGGEPGEVDVQHDGYSD